MEHDPFLLEDLRLLISNVPGLTLTEDMTGPIGIQNGVTIQAVSRVIKASQCNQHYFDEHFGKFAPARIALYRAISNPPQPKVIWDNGVFTTDEVSEGYIILRFAVY